MDLGYDVGDTVIHRQEKVIGKVIKIYFPTTCKQQTMILCEDGRKYHAPSDEFVKINESFNPAKDYIEFEQKLSVEQWEKIIEWALPCKPKFSGKPLRWIKGKR